MRTRLMLLVIGALPLAACGGDDGPGKPAPGDGGGSEPSGPTGQALPDPGPRSLEGHLRVLRRAQLAGDAAGAAIVVRGLVPDAGRVAAALRDDAPTGTARRIASWLATSTRGLADDAAWAGFLSAPADRTEVAVHEATGAAIAAGTPGSVAGTEFPGGAREVAKRLLRPDKRYYQAEFTAPGKSGGTRFHLFFWDGQRWAMLGPVWRMD